MKLRFSTHSQEESSFMVKFSLKRSEEKNKNIKVFTSIDFTVNN